MVLVTVSPVGVDAQATRIQGVNGWLLPVTGNVLSSDEDMHLRRGSVNAWDLTVPKGSPIFAMAPGQVTYAGCNNAGGFGCWVEINHGGGYETRYAHMIMGSVQVSTGQQVDQWTVLGQVGWTGKTGFGPHVHFQIHLNGNRQRIDKYFPLQAMNKCDFCGATGQVETNIQVAGPQQQAQTQQAARGSVSALPAPVTRPVPTVPMIPASWLRWFVLGGMVFAAGCLYLLGSADSLIPSAIGNGGSLALLVTLIASPAWLPMFTPKVTAQPQQIARAANHQSSQAQGVQAPVIAGGDTWDTAYAIMRRWEGTKCVHDPTRTFRALLREPLMVGDGRRASPLETFARSLRRKPSKFITETTGKNRVPTAYRQQSPSPTLTLR